MSADYGQRQPAPVLVYSARARLPLRIVTILLPLADPLAPPPAVSALADERGDLVGLALEDEVVRIDSENAPAPVAIGRRADG